MLQLSAAGKRFGPKLLFEDANWLITPDERTGLVGGNGTGKSTLLKVLAGLETLDYGALTSVKGMTIGYLPQDGLALSGKTVFAECLSVFEPLHALEREAEQITHTLSTADPGSREYRAAADRYSDIANHLHVHDIYTLDSQVGAVLGGLGFSKQDWDAPPRSSPAGWQMRISLAKLLLQKPSLLLLDEPTNHLDLESRNWLEEYLHDYPNAYILVSHDRYFLDVTVSKTIEIWNKRLHTYHGNYEKYLVQKEERRATLMAAYKNQRDRIEQLEAFINRFRYQATKAKQVQSRIKELEDQAHRGAGGGGDHPLHHSATARDGRTVIEVSHLSKDYPMPPIDGQPAGVNHVLKDVRLQDQSRRPHRPGRRQRRGQIHAHPPAQWPGTADQRQGATRPQRPGGLLRAGPVQGPRPRRSHARRHQRHRAQVPVVELRSLLGCFMFSGDDVFKPLGVLSGGERNRYAMAKMLVSPANMLLLDEPTNHLDLRAKDVLLEAIANFTGTVLFVTTTATSSTAWPHASSRWKTTASTSSPATTRTTSGASPAARKKSRPPSQILSSPPFPSQHYPKRPQRPSLSKPPRTPSASIQSS